MAKLGGFFWPAAAVEDCAMMGGCYVSIVAKKGRERSMTLSGGSSLRSSVCEPTTSSVLDGDEVVMVVLTKRSKTEFKDLVATVVNGVDDVYIFDTARSAISCTRLRL